MRRTRTVPRGPRPLLRSLVVAAFFAALLLPGSASAAGWAAFAPVTGNSGVTQPKISADAAGNQVAVWVEQPSPFKVMAAFRPAGGAWGTPQTLDATATTLPNTDVASDGAGNFIVVYSQVVATTYKVFSNYLPAGATILGAQQQMGGTLVGTPTISAPAVALDGQGRAYGVYGINGNPAFGGVRAPGAGSTWSVVNGGLPTNVASPDIAVTGAGEATIAEYPIGGGALRHWRLAANGAAWSQLTTPAGVGNPAGAPLIAVDSQGQTTVLHLAASTFTLLAAQTCPAGLPATCGAKAQLADLDPIASAAGPALAVDRAGDAVAAWSEGGAVAVSQRSGSSGVFAGPVQLGQGATPALAFTSAGTAIAVHEQTGNLIRFALAPVGAVFTPPSQPLTDPATTWVTPRLAADGAGNAFGIWAQSGGAGLQSAIYDAQPPVVDSFIAPATATVGQAVAFTSAVSDGWTGAGSVWDFGDGATSPQPAASHTYAAPGTYNARLTATDGAGNQTTQSQTVTVTAAQAATGPAPLARPVAGRTVNLEPVTGTVLVRVPTATTFVPLTSPTQVRAGAIIDARRGRVRITIDNGVGGLDTADFFGGVFRFTQPAVKSGLRRFANLHLFGGSFKGCPRAPRKPRIADSSAKRRKKSASRSVRRLWGEGEGAFRTVGRFSSATIRGTKWLTNDRCNGTLTKVRVGKVGVRDFVKRRTVVVKARRQYLAKPAAR